MFKLYRPNLPEQVINLLALRFAPVVVPEASSECNFGKLSMISQISNFSSVFFFKGLSFQTDQSAPFVNESYCMTHTILIITRSGRVRDESVSALLWSFGVILISRNSRFLH